MATAPSSLLISCSTAALAQSSGTTAWAIVQPAHGYDRNNNSKAMGLLYELIVDTADVTTTVQLEANTKEEALDSAQELYPGCRLALVKPAPGEQKD
jgi:hypothetical protein